MHRNLLNLFALILIVMATSYGPAMAQSCNRLEAIECVKSLDCMYQRVGEEYRYECITPANRCQIGFVQGGARDGATSGKDICKARPGCSFVPAGECYCPPDVDCICGGGTPPNCAVDNGASLTPPDGRYVIVDVRNASDVAAPLDNDLRGEALGSAMTFASDGISMDDLGCVGWAVESVDRGINFSDPILADVMIGPMDSPISAGDRRILDHWRYSCEGERFMILTQVDRRVLVVLWNNSAQYLIVEKPLKDSQIKRLQKELKSMKFYDGDETGELDDATVNSLGFWAEYRAAPNEVYRFGRTVITENLLDALRVLPPN